MYPVKWESVIGIGGKASPTEDALRMLEGQEHMKLLCAIVMYAINENVP
jgi:hypothetical protein